MPTLAIGQSAQASPPQNPAAPGPLRFDPLTRGETLKWLAIAVACFHLAYEVVLCAPLILGFLYALFRLAHVASRREAMILGWIAGLLVYGPQLAFFWSIFNGGAIALWLVLATWLGLYLILQRFVLLHLAPRWSGLAAPLLWTGLEYFRSELYYLRFSWLNIGYVAAPFPEMPLLRYAGMYGVGFLLMLVAANVGRFRRHTALIGGCGVAAILLLSASRKQEATPPTIKIAGVQLEFPADREVRNALDLLHRNHPEAQLLVLSEYTFDGPVPGWLRQWCADHSRYLVVGAKDYTEASGKDFRNTAFVIGPDGRTVFQQAKVVPIQFFSDGLPAVNQEVWNSPWGKLGLCVCYDLSYTRVTDQLIRRGAEAIIVPTMDVQDWGARQHRLHARVAPVRAAEYGVPIFRLCSSGISQAVGADGAILAAAPFPGQGQTLTASLALAKDGGNRPLDRWLVWPCVAFTLFITGWHALHSIRRHLGKNRARLLSCRNMEH